MKIKGKIINIISNIFYVEVEQKIYECTSRGIFKTKDLKPVVGDNVLIDIIDEEPLLNDEMIELARWVKDRTFCTYYESAKAMLPTGINNKIIDFKIQALAPT